MSRRNPLSHVELLRAVQRSSEDLPRAEARSFARSTYRLTHKNPLKEDFHADFHLSAALITVSRAL
jgi:hypothetical protein